MKFLTRKIIALPNFIGSKLKKIFQYPLKFLRRIVQLLKSLIQKVRLPKVKITIKGVIFTFLFLILIAVSIVSFVFMRHRQLCRYDKLIESGIIQIEESGDTTTSLCPNILDKTQYDIILKNAFNFRLLEEAEINEEKIGFHASSAPTQTCTDTDPACIIKSSASNLKKTDNYTNILIVGSDTRLRDGSVFGNTDTIILATYNHDTDNILLTSFPRDTYVLYDNQYGQRVSSKINSVYVYTGMDGLVKAMKDISGMEVHYYVAMSLNSFNNFIDKIGGIQIELPEDFADVFPCTEIPYGHTCPSPQVVNGGMYGYYTYPKGLNTFSSFDASVYTRARQYSRDNDRAKRQQLVVEAVLKNALEADKSLSEKFMLYQELYDLFRNQIETNISIEDIGPFLSLADKANTDTTNIILDPSFQNGQVVYIAGITEVGWATKFYDMSYGQIRQILKDMVNNLAFYHERPKLLIKKSKDVPLSKEIQEFVDSNPQFLEIKIIDEETEYSGSRVYNVTNIKPSSLKLLRKSLGNLLIYNAKIDGITQTEFGEDFLIIDSKPSE